MSLALASGFFSTEPPGKLCSSDFAITLLQLCLFSTEPTDAQIRGSFLNVISHNWILLIRKRLWNHEYSCWLMTNPTDFENKSEDNGGFHRWWLHLFTWNNHRKGWDGYQKSFHSPALTHEWMDTPGSNRLNWRQHDLKEFSLKKMSKLMYLAIHFNCRNISVIT